MSTIRRQKACIACADSKRRCDKKLPECQRCLDRDIECAYPQPRRRRRISITRDAEAAEVPTLQNCVDASTLGNSLDFGNWGAIETTNLGITLSDVIIPYVPPLSVPVPSASSQEAVLEGDSIANMPCPWFLQDETWVMKHCNEEPACVTFLTLEPFILRVREMLECWVKNGYNGFIHRRLYEKGMPTCLQDAFTTLAAYTSRTAAVKETILQIAEDRSSTLVHQDPLTAGGAQGILMQLARVQSLFVYGFIRLFDGSVRVRASAEQQLPTLRQWVIRMWETVKQYRGEDFTLGHPQFQWTASEFDRQYDAASDMWQIWILTESVRRSHLIIDAVSNIYQTMTKGWAECAGAVMFTARRGLWEAESAMKWFELSCAQSPLLVPSLQPGPLISQYTPEAFDDFAKMYWTFIVGQDKIQCWIDKSNTSGIYS